MISVDTRDDADTQWAMCCLDFRRDILDRASPVTVFPHFREVGLFYSLTGFLPFRFCPYCATEFPPSLREEYIEATTEWGSPRSFMVPESWGPPYDSGEWWRTGKTPKDYGYEETAT